MKSLRLISLTLENFKGTKAFTLSPQGESITIAGTNGSGKTTLFDAYNWLLFGKDSAGRSDSSFDVKPYGSEQPTVRVEGVFDTGEGGTITLARQLTEKVTRQRGTDETSIKNEYKFFVDGVPKTKTQYDSIIAELCPVGSFRMVSDPDYFAGKLKWDERRAVLTRLFGEVDEHSLMADSEEWAALLSEVGERSVADYRAVIAGERKKVKAELEAIPDRIAEAELAMPTTAEPFDPVEFTAREKALQVAEERLKMADDGTAQAELRQQIAEAKTAMAQRKAEYIASFANDEVRKARSDAERELYHQREKRAELEQQRRFTQQSLDDARRELDRLRTEYHSIKALDWDKGAESCPYCGQSLPAERIESLRREFNSDRSYRLEQNITAGKEAAEREKMYTERLAKLTADSEEADSLVAKAQAKLQGLVDAPTMIPFEETSEYAERMEDIHRLEGRLTALEAERAERLSELRQRVSDCREELEEARQRASVAMVIGRQKDRIQELKDQSRALGRRAAELDRMLDAAARFEQYKLSAIEENINSRFAYAKFKLFDHQLNGGYSECCEVVVDGAAYSTNLNPGKKINAGLDIIRTLSQAIGFSAPVFIDNAESYVSIMDIGAQVVCLRVDADADSLTVVNPAGQ